MSPSVGVIPFCECSPRRPTIIFTSRTKKNPFRRFYGCSSYPVGCSFMEWLDEKVEDRLRLEIVHLMSRVEAAENKVVELELKHADEVEELLAKVAASRGKLKAAKEEQKKLYQLQKLLINTLVGVVAVLLALLGVTVCNV